MKQRKNWLAPLLLGLLLTLAACGGSGNAAEWQEQYDLGVRYLSEGNYGEAILAFTAAIEIDPNRAEAYVGRGDAYIGSGENGETLAAALADYQKAVDLDESLAPAWLGLTDIHIRQRDFEAASRRFLLGTTRRGTAAPLPGFPPQTPRDAWRREREWRIHKNGPPGDHPAGRFP